MTGQQRFGLMLLIFAVILIVAIVSSLPGQVSVMYFIAFMALLFFGSYLFVYEEPKKVIPCPRCEGSGILHGSDAGWVDETDDDEVVCPRCGGSGDVIV